MAVLAVGLSLTLLTLLVWGMVHGLRLRCEGFGCTGVGIYWFAWACFCALTGVVSLWARARSRRARVAVRMVRVTVWVPLCLALGLLLWWRLG